MPFQFFLNLDYISLRKARPLWSYFGGLAAVLGAVVVLTLFSSSLLVLVAVASGLSSSVQLDPSSGAWSKVLLSEL
jgi:hypothetical protein